MALAKYAAKPSTARNGAMLNLALQLAKVAALLLASYAFLFTFMLITP
jgi:hypothetical protein